MGTRRSKHNKGRKPTYKDVRSTPSKAIWDHAGLKETAPAAADILARPAFSGGLWLNQRTNWKPSDTEKLRILTEADAPVEGSANSLGRDPKSIAYKARDMGFTLPPLWAILLPKAIYVPRPREQFVQIRYPFLIKVRNEHSDLISVNSLVPKALPDHMRGDICQEILLAVYEGKVNLDTLKRKPSLVQQFIRQWRNKNLEKGGYGIVSVDPLADERSYDEVASAIAAKDWEWNQMNDRRSAYEALDKRLVRPTQIDEVYRSQMRREQRRQHDKGNYLSYAETVSLYG